MCPLVAFTYLSINLSFKTDCVSRASLLTNPALPRQMWCKSSASKSWPFGNSLETGQYFRSSELERRAWFSISGQGSIINVIFCKYYKFRVQFILASEPGGPILRSHWTFFISDLLVLTAMIGRTCFWVPEASVKGSFFRECSAVSSWPVCLWQSNLSRWVTRQVCSSKRTFIELTFLCKVKHKNNS